MEINTLLGISPIDGRYRKVVSSLGDYFSEYALIRYRIRVEVEYFIALCEIPLPQLRTVDPKVFDALRSIYENFSIPDAERVKEIEKVTNHDVKAVEYFIKEKVTDDELSHRKEFIHFGLTSQDINNTAIPLSVKEAYSEVIEPAFTGLIETLEKMAMDFKDVPMLARTHGQPASPTRVGKEIYVFAERLRSQMDLLRKIPFSSKFGGATGNFNAHVVSYRDIDWIAFADSFVEKKLGLKRQRTTTQIEHYDCFAAFLDGIRRMNTILIDLNRDMWSYISMEYFKQKIKKDEVGSSAMPHKVNPIDFENSEGNLGIANALLSHLSQKLPVSRLQRDLTDSTVTRNIGVPLAHTLLSIRSLERGLGKLLLNESAIKYDLQRNWAVIAEAIQCILRREGFEKPYEALKELTRGNEEITRDRLLKFIHSLKVSVDVKEELAQITPENYTGVFEF